MDALRILSHHQCARDMVEEFVGAKVFPLRANQFWFVVTDGERYREWDLKGLSMNVKQAWAKVLQKSNSSMLGSRPCIRRFLKQLRSSLGSLGTHRLR